MFTNRMMSVAARGVSVGAVVGSAAAGAPVFSNTLGDPGFAGSYVAALAAHDDGSGPSLYATGQFSVAGVPGTANLARWNGTAWESVGGGLTGAFSNTLTTFQGDLIAGGYFDLAGGVPGTAKLARWDGVQWNSMDAQSEIFLNSVWDLEVWDDGSGERLYVAGNYVDIGGVGGPDHLAVWDGVSYAPLGAPIGGAVPLIVLDLQVADLGDGERLFAGGRFLTIDGVPANNIAVWDGAAWSALDSGLVRTSGFAQVLTMAVFDDGSGDALFVGGRFDLAGGAPASRIAKWDGVAWSAVGAGFTSDVQELTVFDDGSGPALYAAGNFEAADGGIDHIAKWNGAEWEQVGAGANDNVFGALVFDAGEGDALHFAGSFSQAGGLSTNRVVSLLSQGDPGCNDADIAEPFGVLDLADVQAFIGAFVNMQPPADIAPPQGVWDLADVQAFVGAFVAGCP
jgi:hypothetical protein